MPKLTRFRFRFAPEVPTDPSKTFVAVPLHRLPPRRKKAAPAVVGGAALVAPRARISGLGAVVLSEDWLLGLEDESEESLLMLV